jgi:hypothetical protein
MHHEAEGVQAANDKVFQRGGFQLGGFQLGGLGLWNLILV